ncbi:MAG: cation:proton antiporter [Candidatus Glassbacteria bacterium]|nr:cation:proton antiporter [Candidatus Glassbacteria bacterium]
MNERILLSLASILVLGIGAQWLAWRLRLPSILLLLVFGIIAGPVTGLLDPDLLMGEMLLPVVSISVAIILFEGGLTLRLSNLRNIGGSLLALVTIGVVVTWVVASGAACLILGLETQLAILLGAVLTVTGPTVIGPLLRYIRPTGRVAELLKWEGIVIDPVGALLAVVVFEAVAAQQMYDAADLILLGIGRTVLAGVLLGITAAWILMAIIRRAWVPEFLEETITLSLVVIAYVTSNMLQHEAGLFAATVMGLVLYNQKRVPVKHIVEFGENLRVLIISSLFILLAARLDQSMLNKYAVPCAGFLLVLAFVARPLSVFISTLGSRLSLKEKIFLSWMAPRGIVAAAVSSIFALELVEIGFDQAALLVPFTFAVIIGTVALYGLTSGPLARRLGLSQSDPQGILFVGAHGWARKLAVSLKAKGYRVAMIDTNPREVVAARMMDIPAHLGSALNHRIIEKVNLDGIGKLLAVTPNDEANSMAALHFSEVFDRRELYQLRPGGILSEKEDDNYSPRHLRAHFLFNEKADFDFMSKRFGAGTTIKITPLSNAFGYNDFLELYGPETLPLFLINLESKLRVFHTERKLNPEPGDTIVALVREN